MRLSWTALEPARLRGIAIALVALAAALGLVLPFDLPGITEAIIGVLAVVLPLLQGELTRAVVVPVAKIPAGTPLAGDGPVV